MQTIGSRGLIRGLAAGFLLAGSFLAGASAGNGPLADRHSVSPDCFVQQAKLMSADGTTHDEFGFSSALSGDGNTVLVGAPYADVNGNTNQGAAYVFTRAGNRWVQQAKLSAGDGAASNIFGFAVALSSDGNTALISAPYAEVNSNTYQGAAYLFTCASNTWSQAKKIVPDDGAAGHLFGYAVALSTDGTTALIGATWSMITNYGAGGYVFTRSSGWNQQAKLTAADGTVKDGFGAAVALSGNGNTALIGAQAAKSGVIPTVGAAYLFTRSGGSWSQQKKLMASDGTQGAYFGCATALNGDGNTALVGAFSAIAGSGMPGAAYVFTLSGSSWTQQAKLEAADGLEWDDFGSAVGLSSDGNTALIGAPDADVSGHADQGAGYVFRRSGATWSQQAKLAANDGTDYDYFGCAAALSADAQTVLIGAYYPKTGYDQKRGAGYVFTVTNIVSRTGPTIMANGATGTVAVVYPDPATITAAMNADIYAGACVDWWWVAFAHTGEWYYLNSLMQWTPFSGNLSACRPVWQGPLADVAATTVLSSVLPRGTYDFWFAVDYPMDGVLKPDGQILVDKVTVLVQ